MPALSFPSLARLLSGRLSSRQKPLSTSSLYLFFELLGTLLKSGIPLAKSLQTIEEDAPRNQLSALSRELRTRLESGQKFSAAIEATNRFPRFTSALIKAAESSGRLGDVAERLSQTYAARQSFQRAVTSALAYPAFLLLISFASLVVIVMYILPAFEPLFAQQDSIPAHLSFLFSLKSAFSDYLETTLILILIPLIFIFFIPKMSKKFKHPLDRFVLRIPYFGRMLGHLHLQQILQTLGTLLQNGIHLPEALTLAEDATRNSAYAVLLARCREDVQKGRKFSQHFQSLPHLPATCRQMLLSGEQSGRLPEMLLKSADQLSAQVQTSIQRLTTLLGPVMILVVGLIIGGIVFSLLGAVYGLTAGL